MPWSRFLLSLLAICTGIAVSESVTGDGSAFTMYNNAWSLDDQFMSVDVVFDMSQFAASDTFSFTFVNNDQELTGPLDGHDLSTMAASATPFTQVNMTCYAENQQLSSITYPLDVHETKLESTALAFPTRKLKYPMIRFLFQQQHEHFSDWFNFSFIFQYNKDPPKVLIVHNRIALSSSIKIETLASKRHDLDDDRSEFKLHLINLAYDILSLQIELYGSHYFYLYSRDHAVNRFQCTINDDTEVTAVIQLLDGHLSPPQPVGDSLMSYSFINTFNISLIGYKIRGSQLSYTLQCDDLLLQSNTHFSFEQQSSVHITAQTVSFPTDEWTYPCVSTQLNGLKFTSIPNYFIYSMVLSTLFVLAFGSGLVFVNFWNKPQPQQFQTMASPLQVD